MQCVCLRTWKSWVRWGILVVWTPGCGGWLVRGGQQTPGACWHVSSKHCCLLSNWIMISRGWCAPIVLHVFGGTTDTSAVTVGAEHTWGWHTSPVSSIKKHHRYLVSIRGMWSGPTAVFLKEKTRVEETKGTATAFMAVTTGSVLWNYPSPERNLKNDNPVDQTNAEHIKCMGNTVALWKGGRPTDHCRI